MPDAVKSLARKTGPTAVVTAFFAVLALDISVPALVLLGLASVRGIGIGMADAIVASGHPLAGERTA